ncbi:molybdopterin-dependent oxidoreductase [Sphingomonas sp. CGMCC 1.13654]|uniref:Molybdopterin-dependent oxidoreductase n=1 Tax=Sphingomonas chungangi TaxID=2683589 RepID=A0A838L471_9SPHN|nr:molybdopterin-dependent oxidoreductase [Sphingomonas chungangi]MBA2933837.1 molybdopterin-dependent oxidoreductase [Sphingomonas chungangi]MVW55167.1 molybdopterin-dependent oxidoreductase [Sphingomonas chungangi]
MEQRYSYCRNCAANCGMVFEVEDNRIVSARSDRANIVSEGYVCIKGTMAVDLHKGAEDRLTHCLKRAEDGSYHPIDKYQAVDEIAAKLRAILDRHGPRALGSFFGTTSYSDCVGKPFLKSLMNELGAPATFSSMTVDQSSKWVTAARLGHWACGKPLYTQTDVILLAGLNPLVSHSGYPNTPIPGINIHHHFKEAKKRGIKFIVIDPRRTEAAPYADIFIQPKPGYDAAIFAALLREIFRHGWEDRAFADRYTVNLDALRASVEPFTAERVAKAAGVGAEQIIAAAELLGTARKPGTGTGTGLNMAAFSNTAEHLCEAMTALIGGYLRAGDSIPNPGILVPRSEVELIYPPHRSWEKEPKCASDPRFGKLMGEFPASIFPDEVLHGGDKAVRALFVTGSNPAMTLGEPEVTLAALRELELLVTFDPRPDSETARLSHYVIAPTLMFERSEVTTFTEWLFHFPFVQYAQQIVEPPPQTMGEDEFFWLLAKRLGVQLELKNIPFGADIAMLPPGLKIDMETMPSRDSLIAWLVSSSPVSFEELKRSPHGVVRTIEKTIRAPEQDDGNRLDLCPSDVVEEIAAVDAFVAGEGRPARAFLLTSRRIVESFNSSFQGNVLTRRRHGTNRLNMHPDDMAMLRIGAEEGVCIESDDGAIIGYVRPDATMKPGVVSMAHCWGTVTRADPLGLRGGHTGSLVSLHKQVQSINRMPRQSGIPVDIAPLGLTLWEARAREEMDA